MCLAQGPQRSDDSLLIVTPIVGFCNCSMFCCALLYVLLDGEEKAGCFALFVFLMIVVWLFLVMPKVCLQFVIVVFPDHTHLLSLWSPAGKKLTS